MQLRAQRAQNVRFVQMIGRGNDDGIELVGVEQLLEVGKHVGHIEAVSERARLRSIVVAERNERGSAQLRQHRNVRELSNGTCTNNGDAHAILH